MSVLAPVLALVLAPVLALLPAQRCLANEGADHTTGIWMVTQASGSLGDPASSRWHFAIDAQARYFDIGSGLSQWLIRPAVGYTVGPQTRIWAGFGRFRVRDREGRSIYENRPWQQIDWQRPGVAGGRLQFRLRLEQRKLEDADDTRWVLRFLADYQRPLSLLGADRLILAVEPFFDLNRSDWGGGSGISQHRLVAGLSWPLHPGLAFEAGYMNQYFHAEEGLDRSNHLAVLRLRLRY